MEGEKVEYKKSLKVINDILKSIIAFANTEGGEVRIGIDDKGKAVGVSIGKNTMENLASVISREIEPKVDVSLKTTEIDGKEIIVITIPLSPLKPHFFKGTAYKRVGKASLKLSSRELEQMLVSRILSLHDVDSLRLNIESADISDNLVKKYVREMGKAYRGVSHALRALGLADNGRIYPSAILFFGKDPARFFPLYGVKCAIFKGNEILTFKDFSQPIYEVVTPALNFMKQNIPSEIRFREIKRYEEPKIPVSVLREALLNALIHADYTMDATIYIRITEDFVEIKNGGTLPPPLTIEELKKPHLSKPRNKRIAALCHRVGWIEHWGEGTLKIVRRMRERALDVKFEEKNGYFSVKLSTKEITLNKRQQKIFQKIKALKSVTVKDLKTLRIPERTIRADLAFLVKKGLVKKKGKGKLTHYTL